MDLIERVTAYARAQNGSRVVPRRLVYYHDGHPLPPGSTDCPKAIRVVFGKRPSIRLDLFLSCPRGTVLASILTILLRSLEGRILSFFTRRSRASVRDTVRPVLRPASRQ